MMRHIRGIVKQFMPYGLMCTWLRVHYHVELDKPLLYYPGWAKRIRRVLKFVLPYGIVMRVKQPDPTESLVTTPHPLLTASLPSDDVANLRRKILIVAELSIPQCKYYRVDQKVAMFKSLEIPVEVANWTDRLDCVQKMQTATIVIFYRVPFFELVQLELAEARRLGLRVGFDVDDIVFDEAELSKNRSLDSLSKKDRADVFKGAALYKGLLEKCDFTIASTPVLSKFMQRYCQGPAYVLPNAICKSLVPKPCRFPLGLDGKIVIGYGSGTKTHDADFDQCAKALMRIFEKHPDVELVLHGHLSIPECLTAFEDRILRVPFVPFSEYANAISRIDINLIPLEDSVFNDCKSNIKYLEASRLAVPSVASPRAEFTSVIEDGKNGFLADSEEEWFSALEKLVADSDLRLKVGKAAEETVSRLFDGDKFARETLLSMVNSESPAQADDGRKKILFANILFAPTSFGGATILLENLVEAMAEHVDVAVFSICWDGSRPLGSIVRYHHGKAMCFMVESEPYGAGERDYRSPAVTKAFAEVVESYQPDVVHFHSIQQMGVDMLGICRQFGIPYVVTAHDAWWLCPRQFMLDDHGNYCRQDERGVDLYRCANCYASKDLFPRWHVLTDALRGACAVLTPSDFQTELYVKSGLPKDLVRTNRNGIPVPRDVPPHRVHMPLTFAYLGGKCQHKGYFFLQRVVSRLQGDYKLKLVDLNLKFGTRSMSASEWPHPEKIEICQPFDHHGMDEFYRGIDVLLFPSCWKESFGLTIREALARNIWVIATRAGGDLERDLVSGVNGDLVDMFDEEGFAAAMQKIIDNPFRLSSYDNPCRNQIRTVVEQAEELIANFECIVSGEQKIDR